MEQIIETIKKDILKLISPETIILFNKKINLSNEISSFKICLIIKDFNSNNENNINEIKGKEDLEKLIYTKIESEIPFDVIIYTLTEWETSRKDKLSFASKIVTTGSVIYEK